MPLYFWDEASATATYLINRLPTPVLNNISPLEKLFGHKPNYPSLKTFGLNVFPTYDHTNLINYLFDLNLVVSLAIVRPIKAIDAYLLMVILTSLVMFYLKNNLFLMLLS